MFRVDEQVERRWRFGLASFVLSAALALVLPALASAALVPLEVEKEGAGEGTVTSSPAGISCDPTCSAEFEEGKEVTLTATPSGGSEFVSWEGCDSEPEGKCRVTMSEWRIVTAIFEEVILPEYSLEINEGGNGEGEWECLVGGEEEFCESEYPAGTNITIKAIPYEGSKFSGFSGDCTGTSCTLKMDKDHSVTAIFTLKEFSLTVKQNGTGSGKVECELEEGPKECLPKYPWETEVTLIAVPDLGSEFVEWKGCDKTPQPGLCVVEIEEARSVSVTFNAEPSGLHYTLKIEREGTGTGSVTSEPVGIDCGEDCAEEFPDGEKVTLVAVADEGSVFKGWSNVSGSCTKEAVCWTAMGADKTVKAVFTATGTRELKANKVGTGTGKVTSLPVGIDCGATCSAEFATGAEVTLTATPDSGSEFVSWSGACAGSGACKVTMSAAKEATATFNLKPILKYTLTVQREGTGAGSVTSDPAGIECGGDCAEDYAEGTTVTLTAAPAAGSVFKRWSGVEGGCALEPVCKTKMGGPKAVKAIFSSTESAPPPDAMGRAKVAKRIALVRGGRALLALRCTGGSCAGRLKLIARVKKGEKMMSLVIGKRSFSLASGTTRSVRVVLSGPAQIEVSKRGKLAAQVKGGGVLHSIVELKRSNKRR